jgi:hypothetical protein
MNSNLPKIFSILTLLWLITNCATQKTSTVVGGDYNESKHETDYFVLPYGSVKLPGKWEKTIYNSVSSQQFFRNKDSITIAISFGRIDKYEFNTDDSKKGYEFVEAFYDWDSEYFVNQGLKRQIIVRDSINKYMIYRIYGEYKKDELDTYFLIGERNGSINNFSITKSDKWTEDESIDFLKRIFLVKK